MAFSAGDKVRFLYSPQVGSITSVLKNGFVEVEIESGFTVKVPQSEVVKDFSSPEDFKKPITTHPDYIQKTRPQKKKKIKAAVDLHISNPSNQILNLTNGEIIESQLQKLSTAIIKALSDGTRELVVIHGVGTGALKKAIYDFLKHNRHIKSISDADYKKYGKGATKITL